MRLVIIESPFGKNPDGTPADDATLARNIRYLRACMRDCFRRGEAPFASHGLYPGVLDERDPEQRKLGMQAGWAWHLAADAIAIYEDLGVTPGMLAGLESSGAKTLRAMGKIEHRRLGEGWDVEPQGCNHEQWRLAGKFSTTEPLRRFDADAIGGHYEVVWCERCGAVWEDNLGCWVEPSGGPIEPVPT